MLGSRPGTRRPPLLILVFGAFLVVIGITATAQAVIVSLHFSAGTLNTVVAGDSATVRAVLNDRPSDAALAPAADIAGTRLSELDAKLTALTGPGEILRVELRRLDGTIIAASDRSLAGTRVAPVAAATEAAADHPSIALVDAADAGAGGGGFASPTLLREVLPLSTAGRVRAGVGIWRDGVPLLARLDGVRRDIVAVTLTAALVVALLLFLIFRGAQGRLSRQTAALVESGRRDPLTGMLNHGALVGHLAGEIERARDAGRPLGLALIDIDNFRLLNDNHGHRAGDDALMAVAAELQRQMP